ncbi:Glycoside hydrolase-type carbohydrate-binding, subgroup [Phytophthora cactorum]|nr:Glycoside hydrolase-type carbohydrate-binding, subgroup [Phytophthora cactorum]
MSAAKKSVIELCHPSGSRAEVHLYGATVTSFYAAQEPERNVLFLSSKALLDGIATFALDVSQEMRAMYPHDFGLVYEVKLFANALATAIHIQNKSEGDMAFQALLHTYLSVDDVRDGGVVVEGLKGLTYHDKVAGQEKTEERDVLTFDQETDSVYANAHVTRRATWRVWNPWIDKAKGMSDFGDDEYPTMVCVEPGRVSEQQKLPAGQTFALLQVIKLSALSSNNFPHGGGGSRRYRRVAHTHQVDDTLFGEKNQLLKNRKNDRTLQAGRMVTKTPIVVVPEDELERIKAETKILTAADLEALEAKREADQEHQRLTSKARKEHMLKLTEKQEILRRARVLKDQMHDSVKLMKTLGTRAQAFTIRDQQLKVKKDLEDEHHVYDEKMNTLMEIERLESLKRQEHRDEVKKQKRYADRKVLEDQIEDRRRQRQKESEIVAQEAQEMLAKIQRQQEEEAEKEKAKALRAQRSMEEIKRFNEDTLMRKQDVQRKIKEEEDAVYAYQMKKAEDLKLREEEEAQRRHEAELRCAKLRSMQEKMANEKAELDELRAKRAAEARERQAREADMALARKHKEEMDELRRAREAQALHRERARVKEATLQQREYDSIMVQVESDKARVKEEDEKRKLASMAHRRVLQSQIEEKERLKKITFVKKQEEGQALKEEYAKELEKLERIRMEEVGELVEAGVNPLYLSEMKALVIEKQIRCTSFSRAHYNLHTFTSDTQQIVFACSRHYTVMATFASSRQKQFSTCLLQSSSSKQYNRLHRSTMDQHQLANLVKNEVQQQPATHVGSETELEARYIAASLRQLRAM